MNIKKGIETNEINENLIIKQTKIEIKNEFSNSNYPLSLLSEVSSIESTDNSSLSSSSCSSSIESNQINNNEIIKRQRERDLLIEKYGRENVRFHGNSTILLDSEKYRLKRQSNNEASKRSKKRKESKEKIGKFFINFMIRKLIEDKKKLKQEIEFVQQENQKLRYENEKQSKQNEYLIYLINYILQSEILNQFAKYEAYFMFNDYRTLITPLLSSVMNLPIYQGAP